MSLKISDLHTKLVELIDSLDKHDVEAATQQALDLQKAFHRFLGEWFSQEPELRVIRAIAALKMSEIQGNTYQAQQVFAALIPKFVDRYPEHKLLTTWCQQAQRPKEISSASLPQIASSEMGDIDKPRG